MTETPPNTHTSPPPLSSANMLVHEMFILLQHRPSFAAMQPVLPRLADAGVCVPVILSDCLSPHWAFFPLTGTTDYSLIQTPPSPSLLNAPLKPHSAPGPLAQHSGSSVYPLSLLPVSHTFFTCTHPSLPCTVQTSEEGVLAQQWASSGNFMQDLAERALLHRGLHRKITPAQITDSLAENTTIMSVIFTSKPLKQFVGY